MTPSPTVSTEDRTRGVFDLGFNEALVDAHDRAVAACDDPPEDVSIFDDPRVRRVLAYAILGLVALVAVVGLVLFVEWLLVGRDQVSPVAASRFVRLGVGLLLAAGLAGLVAVQIKG